METRSPDHQRLADDAFNAILREESGRSEVEPSMTLQEFFGTNRAALASSILRIIFAFQHDPITLPPPEGVEKLKKTTIGALRAHFIDVLEQRGQAA